MPANLMPWPLAKFYYPGTNLPLVGGKVYTYIAGTSTPLATYPTPAATPGTENTNPIILDVNGEASIYLTNGSSYKINVTTSTDVQIPNYPIDNIIGPNALLETQLASSSGASMIGYGSITVEDALDNLSLIETHDYGSAATGTLTIPANARYMEAFLCGAGSGGGGGSDFGAGGGGGAGARAMWIFYGDIAGEEIDYTCGTAGTNGTYSATGGANCGLGSQTSIVWSNSWTQIAGAGGVGIASSNSPSAGSVSGQGGAGGNTAESGSVMPGVSYGQFNIVSMPGMSAQTYLKNGSWTPVLTFATPGDLNVAAYSVQAGDYTLDGDVVDCNFNITTNGITFTTASGNLRITGLPFTKVVGGAVNREGPLQFQGITKVNYTNFSANIASSANYAEIYASGSGQSISAVDAANCASGTNITLRGSVSFRIASGANAIGGLGGNQGDIGGGSKGGDVGQNAGGVTTDASGGYIHIRIFG